MARKIFKKKRVIKNSSIRIKLLLGFLGVSLIPMIFIGALSYFSARKTINEKISRYSDEALQLTVSNFEVKLRWYEDILTQMAVSKSTNSFLKEYIRSDNSFALQKNKEKFKAFLEGYRYTDTGIQAFLFMPEGKEGNYDYVESSQGKDLTHFAQSFRETDIYKQAVEAKGMVVWSKPMPVDTFTNFIVMAREISSENTQEELGVFAVCIDEESINRMLNYLILIAKDGTVISAPDKGILGIQADQIIDDKSFKKNLAGSLRNTGCFIGDFQEKQVLINYRNITTNDWIALKTAPTSYLYADIKTVGRVTLLFGIIFLIIVVLISYQMSAWISKALNQVVRAMRQAEEGNLATRVQIDSQDELGNLGWSFNHMVGKMVGLILETKNAITAVFKHSDTLIDSVKQSAQSAESVAAATEQISQGMIEQTNETERSSQQMGELSVQIELLVNKAEQVEAITNSTKALSLRTKETVGLLTEKTDETDRITNTINKDMTDLIGSAGEISKITDLIANIAEQTTLLALNAAIEAARAGAAGRGFAVVADEVNKLALESQEAASTINKILERIEDKSKTSSETVQMVRSTMTDQKNAVLLVEKSFEGVIASMDSIVGRLEEISDLIRRISQHKDQTVQSIISISTVSEETSASAEEVSAAAEEQTAIANQVQSLVDQLRVLAEELTRSINRFQLH